MTYWKPNYANLVNSAVNQGTSQTMIETEIPSVGMILLLEVMPWGVNIVDENSVSATNAKYVEVEVKAVKTVRTVIE